MRVDPRLDVRLEEQVDLLDRHVLHGVHLYRISLQKTLTMSFVPMTKSVHTVLEQCDYRFRHRNKDVAHVVVLQLNSKGED
jgi:hypothetical protein